MKTPRQQHRYPVRDPRQRKALTSPLRQEILGQWTDTKPRSVADVAAGMGRPATSVYYHVHRLEEVGLLVRTGTRPGPKRDEILYRPVARQFDMSPEPGDRKQVADAVAAIGVAQRMATADLKAALESGEARFDGPDRSLMAFRLHARLTQEKRARVNALLDELLAIFSDKPAHADDGEFSSLTIAFAPLRGRDQRDDP